MTSDSRMTGDLIIDVLGVLERHGYHGRDTEHAGQAICMICDLAPVYEGTRDAPHYARPLRSPHPEPGQPAPEAGKGAVILSADDAKTIVAALDEALLYKRDRVATCADCVGQSCGTCQWRLQAAETYDRLAVQVLEAIEVSRAVADKQSAPGRPSETRGQPQAETGKEAGQ
jgi:hypothetical protein